MREVKQLTRAVAGASLDATERQQERKFFRLRRDLQDGGWKLGGYLTSVQGELLHKELERVMEADTPNPETGLFDPYEKRMADALADMASMAIGRDSDPDRATLVVHVDAAALATSKGVAETEDGTPLPIETVQRFLCDCYVEPVFEGPRDQVGIGRKSRVVPPWLMRRLRKRDKGCRFPGCNNTALVHAHHMQWWVRDRGPTDEEELLCLCPEHHTLLHEQNWSVRGSPSGEVVFMRPDGREFNSLRHGLRPDTRERFLPELEHDTA